MATQTTYSENIAAAVAGLQGTMIPATIISRNVKTQTSIGFGRAVARGSDDKGCKLFGSGDTAVLGISLLDRSAHGEDLFPENTEARIITKGHVWVTASVAVDAGDPVYVIPATGAFAKTSASSAIQIANAVWDTSTTGEGLALVRMG